MLIGDLFKTNYLLLYEEEYFFKISSFLAFLSDELRESKDLSTEYPSKRILSTKLSPFLLA